MDNQIFTYYAFISYKREDEKWAKWLQKKLESYGFPVALRKDNPSLPQKIRPIFRDQSDLSGGNLKEEIEKGLAESKYLIVICSPRSAKSPWVSKEVRYFIDCGRENYIIPFIIGGSPNASNPEDECFPEGLRLLSGEREILGININEMGRDAAAIKVIARMFNLRFDTLWQRHERDKRRKRFAVIASIVLFALISLGVGIYMTFLNTQITNERDRANNERDRANFEKVRAERISQDLVIANDSIKRSYELLNKTLSQLNISNKNLENANLNLKIEKDNVIKAMLQTQVEQIKLKSTILDASIDEGRVLSSIRDILDLLPDGSNNQPLVAKSLSVLNEGFSRLLKEGYKPIDILPTDSLISRDGHWCAYNLDGEYFVYDILNQKSYKLPGEDRVDFNEMYITKDGLLHGIGCEHFYTWNLITRELIESQNIAAEYNSWINNYDYDIEKGPYLPSCRKKIQSYYSFLNHSNNKSWGNYKLYNFESFDSPEQTNLFLYNLNKQLYKVTLDKNYNINSDYNFSPEYPILAYREDGYSIRVIDFKNFSNSEYYEGDHIFASRKSDDGIDDKIIALNSGYEVLVNAKLYTNRQLKPLYAEAVRIPDTNKPRDLGVNQNGNSVNIIERDGKTWQLIDSRSDLSLYASLDTEMKLDGFSDLLLINGSHFYQFKPFVSYTMGNGLSFMFDAKILNGNEILIIAAQGLHSVYNIHTQERRYFSASNLNSFASRYCHMQMFIAGASIINNNKWLITSSGGGVISIYDINSGCLIMEYNLKMANEEFNEHLYFEPTYFSPDGTYVLGYIDGDGGTNYFVRCNIPSVYDYINHARSEFKRFWASTPNKDI